jgi:hypothetical protein
MKRLKPLKKLSISATTIRILTDADSRRVAGGLPTDTNEPGNKSPLCLKPYTALGCAG